MTNGGLEVVNGSHEMDIPVNEDDHIITSGWVASQTWTPVELEAGMRFDLLATAWNKFSLLANQNVRPAPNLRLLPSPPQRAQQ
jgi:hypothetical protein